ncbi:MAG TPA: hypothetical protein VKY44_06055 [Flavobacterium sp.]|nr:hypothetical protein [Flavobacterium sp.]
MGGGIYYIRLVGGALIWISIGFKGSLKECVDKSEYAVELGFFAIFVSAYVIFNW